MTMAILHRKIINCFEQKMANLRGLRGLKIKEVRKFVRRNSVQGNSKNDLIGSNALESQIAVFEKNLDFLQVSKSMLTASGKNGLMLTDDISISSKNQFWSNYCQPVPESGKVGEFIDENEILVLEIDSLDIWIRIKLVMSQS